MRVTIVQKQLFPYFGVMAVAGALEAAGHQVQALIETSEADIVSAVTSTEPDVVGFSVLSCEHKWLRALVADIKRSMPEVPTIVGGVHAILYPREILEIEGVDYVCYGEGEIAFPRFLEHLSCGGSLVRSVIGIGCSSADGIVLQGVAPLASDLNRIHEDRTVYYDRYAELRNLPQKIFMSARGCPFKCAFCANSYIMQSFRGLGKYVRRKGPRELVEEVRQVVSEYGAKSLFFCDDLFVFDLPWLREFASLYKSEVAVPYICTGRAGVIKSEHARLLADSGCHTVSFGVETGNEAIRMGLLNKTVTDAQLLECASVLKGAGIELQTSNMFCLPGERIEDAISTIELNMKMGTDYMFTTVLLPFPKTELAAYCQEKGMLAKDYSFDDMPNSFIMDSVLDVENKEYLVNLHKVAHLCLRLPRLKPALTWMATNIRSPKLFFLLYLLGTFVRYKAERKLSFLETVRYLWSYRRGY